MNQNSPPLFSDDSNDDPISPAGDPGCTRGGAARTGDRGLKEDQERQYGKMETVIGCNI